MNESTDKPFPAAVLDAIHQGRKIEAIKLVREEFSIDLKDAKELVEKYIEDNSELLSMGDRTSSSGGVSLMLLIIFIILVAAAYTYL